MATVRSGVSVWLTYSAQAKHRHHENAMLAVAKGRISIAVFTGVCLCVGQRELLFATDRSCRDRYVLFSVIPVYPVKKIYIAKAHPVPFTFGREYLAGMSRFNSKPQYVLAFFYPFR